MDYDEHALEPPDDFPAAYVEALAELAAQGEQPVEMWTPEGWQVTYAPSVKWFILGKTAIPSRFRVVVDGYPICVLDLATDDFGRVGFDRISFAKRPGDPPLQVAKLRAPLDGYRRAATNAVAALIAEQRPDGTLVMRRGTDTVSAFSDDYTKVMRRPSQRGKKMSEADLRRIAELYRAAVAEERPYASAIAKEFFVSERDARKKVGLARKAGFLGRAIPGRAGEQPIDKQEGESNG